MESHEKAKEDKAKRKMMGARLLLISGSWVMRTICTNAAKSNTKRPCVCSHIDTVEKGQIVFLMSDTLWEALELNGTYHSYSLLNYCSQFIAARVLSFHSWSHSICINVQWISNVYVCCNVLTLAHMILCMTLETRLWGYRVKSAGGSVDFYLMMVRKAC